MQVGSGVTVGLDGSWDVRLWIGMVPLVKSCSRAFREAKM